jgi:hypothetical protein
MKPPITKQLIFLTEADLDRYVYRVFSFKRLEEMFQEKKLTLVKPKLWDDPFENFILNSKGKTKSGETFEMAFRNNFYGQCWSLTKESDAMWRIYSPTKDGVKVKTTIRKLINQLYNTSGTFKDLSAFIGRVKYQSKKDLLKMLSDKATMTGKILDQTGRGQASTFFFKRWAFRHENEVRLIYNGQENQQYDTYKFNFNPIDLIEDIVFDPRIDKKQYEDYKSQVINWGFNNKVIRSGLYEVPKLIINLEV